MRVLNFGALRERRTLGKPQSLLDQTQSNRVPILKRPADANTHAKRVLKVLAAMQFRTRVWWGTTGIGQTTKPVGTRHHGSPNIVGILRTSHSCKRKWGS